MKPQDPKAETITFGVELETTIPTTSDVGVGAYHFGTSVVEGIETATNQRVSAPTFHGNYWKAERDGSILVHLLKAPAPSCSNRRHKPLLDFPDTCGNPDT